MARRLTGPLLLVLQFLAKGYSEAQIATLTDRQPETVRALAAEAAAALDAEDARGAITEATRRGLIA